MILLRGLFSHDLQDQPSLPGPGIQFQEDYLLPVSQHKSSLGEGNAETGPYQRCSDMRVAVSILLAEVVGVVDIIRCQPLQGSL